tara:strand:+ start:730 stop:2052 length:1323 start_codon:yes stop_codon:yes gene_type:complete
MVIKKDNHDMVYIALSADILHHGHINIFTTAAKLGEVVVGLMTDEAIAQYTRLPLLNYDQRKLIVENIKGVTNVIPQDSPSYRENLIKVKPRYVIHGDDWKSGHLESIRSEVIETLRQWGGELIDVPYTSDINSTSLSKAIRRAGTTPDIRLKSLKRLLGLKPYLRFLDIHNGLSALIVESMSISVEGSTREFDGMWASSLTDSTAKGKPDIEAVDVSSRITTLDGILEVTTKPIIYDGDTGGLKEHFQYTVRTLERLGVSAVIIEDKIGLKRNSLFGSDANQTQDTIDNFCEKIQAGKRAQFTDDFMIIARIESLILEKGLEDALTRAAKYITAGADGIMIHSRSQDGEEILDFCDRYNTFLDRKPLVVVPTSFNSIYESKLSEKGVNVIIYANQLLRSAYPAMLKTAESILKNQRSLEADKNMMSIKEILNLVPSSDD